MNEPFQQYVMLDIIRCLIIPAAWILAAMVIKLAWQRWLTRREDETWEKRTHPIMMLSYAVAVFFIGVRRADQLGGPFDPWMLPGVAVLILGYIGLFLRIGVSLPFRRRRDR